MQIYYQRIEIGQLLKFPFLISQTVIMLIPIQDDCFCYHSIVINDANNIHAGGKPI